MNKAIISGNITRDLEIIYSKENNVKIGRFTLAVRRDKGNTDFINCISFGKTTDFMEKYAHEKGQKITVIGRLQTRHYTDKDSKEVYVVEIVVESIEPVWSTEPKKDQFGNDKQDNPFTPVAESDIF